MSIMVLFQLQQNLCKTATQKIDKKELNGKW